jgi:hypothetical protein
MVHWHVERKSVCIYSQVTSTTATEAASMIEGLPRALDLHEAAVAGADDVHVGLGFDVFLVGEVEQGHATTLPRGDRAGERLGLGPGGVPHDRSVGR